MKENISFVISALCNQTEMKSDVPVVLHSICGQRMLDYVQKAARGITDSQPVILMREEDRQLFEHAYQSMKSLTAANGDFYSPGMLDKLADIAGNNEYILLIPGNMPLVREMTLRDMIQYTKDMQLDAAFLSGHEESFPDLPLHYRIGCYKADGLQKVIQAVKSIAANGNGRQINLSEVLGCTELKTGIFQCEDTEELMMVNDRISLSDAEARMRIRINEFHMRNGVTLIDPCHTYIGPDVRIGRDSVVYPGNVLEGNTSIGSSCVLYPNNRINNAIIHDYVTIQSSVVLDSSIGEKTTVGPYAYIRPDSHIGSHVRIGDFVEVKKAVIGDGTKVSHLTYVGDAELGKNINVGCGVVFSNYDGKRKYKIKVGDHAFIGCNTNLVAPVEVEHDSYIAAGSTITEKVPAKALAIARARQVNKEGWVDRREQKERQKTEESK